MPSSSDLVHPIDQAGALRTVYVSDFAKCSSEASSLESGCCSKRPRLRRTLWWTVWM